LGLVPTDLLAPSQFSHLSNKLQTTSSRSSIPMLTSSSHNRGLEVLDLAPSKTGILLDASFYFGQYELLEEDMKSNRSNQMLGLIGLAFLFSTAAVANDTAEKKKLVSKAIPTLSASQIDGRIDAMLVEAKLKTQVQSSDGEFLRRISLDLTGTIPGRKAVVGFLASTDPQKREKLIDRLIKSPEYAEHLTDFWMDVLTSTKIGDRKDRNLGSLRRWVSRQVKLNTPYDQFVSRLVRAQGYVNKNGAVAFMLRFDKDRLALAATTSRLFMGAQIECAQCHDHPFADWKQEQFLEMAAWFTRMEVRNKLKSTEEIAVELSRLSGAKRKRYIERARRDASYPGVFEKFSGDLVVNERGEPITRKNRAVSKEQKKISPDFISKIKLDRKEPPNRREAFALRLTSPKNKLFAQMGVNRIWARFFGRGIVNPVDDLSDISLNTHPELFEGLGKSFVAAKYDVNKLVRAIVLSKTYQRTSEPTQDDSVESESGEDSLMSLYGRMPVRPMSARPLARALVRAVAAPDPRTQARMSSQVTRSLMAILGKRSMDLDRYEETMQEVLFMQNSNSLYGSFRGRDNFVSYLLRTQPNDRERITRLFVNILTRPPSSRELVRYEKFVTSQTDKQVAYEDIVWVLLNSSEFRYNH
jgi:hypothetical protein